MLAARVIPRILLGSVAGVFVDRWDRRRTLIVAKLLLALGLLPLLVVTPGKRLWFVYVVAASRASPRWDRGRVDRASWRGSTRLDLIRNRGRHGRTDPH